MAPLRERMNRRTAEKPRPANESIGQEMAAILHPMLVAALHPQTFTGNLGVSIHLQDGSIGHVKEFSHSHSKPGALPQASAAVGDCGVDNVLQSATRDLLARLGSLVPGYFGVVMLTLEIDRGMCTLVTCSHERVHRLQSPRIAS